MSDETENKLVQRNEDGSLTKETIKRAMKAIRKRIKIKRLDEESRLGHDAMSSGLKSTITGVRPPEQYPPEVWEELAVRGRLRKLGEGLFEIVEM